jgi:hypothetical protein
VERHTGGPSSARFLEWKENKNRIIQSERKRKKEQVHTLIHSFTHLFINNSCVDVYEWVQSDPLSTPTTHHPLYVLSCVYLRSLTPLACTTGESRSR